MNRAAIIGRVVAAPELLTTTTGTRVARIQIEVPRRPTAYTHPTPGDASDVFTVTAWDRLAESASRSAAPGRLVSIEGKLRVETWETSARTRVEIAAETITYLEPRMPQSLTATDDAERSADAVTI